MDDKTTFSKPQLDNCVVCGCLPVAVLWKSCATVRQLDSRVVCGSFSYWTQSTFSSIETYSNVNFYLFSHPQSILLFYKPSAVSEMVDSELVVYSLALHSPAPGRRPAKQSYWSWRICFSPALIFSSPKDVSANVCFSRCYRGYFQVWECQGDGIFG